MPLMAARFCFWRGGCVSRRLHMCSVDECVLFSLAPAIAKKITTATDGSSLSDTHTHLSILAEKPACLYHLPRRQGRKSAQRCIVKSAHRTCRKRFRQCALAIVRDARPPMSVCYALCGAPKRQYSMQNDSILSHSMLCQIIPQY